MPDEEPDIANRSNTTSLAKYTLLSLLICLFFMNLGLFVLIVGPAYIPGMNDNQRIAFSLPPFGLGLLFGSAGGILPTNLSLATIIRAILGRTLAG